MLVIDSGLPAGRVSRYYVGIALSCVLLLMVAFMYFGLCFGACGETAGADARLCNRGTGACLLLMYVSRVSSLSITCHLLGMLRSYKDRKLHWLAEGRSSDHDDVWRQVEANNESM